MEITQAVIPGPDRVEVQTTQVEDRSPQAGEIIIETEATFISAGTELSIYTGREAAAFRADGWCAYPWRPGYGNVGIVRKIGDGVTRTKVGQRVFTFQRHASMVTVNQHLPGQAGFLVEVPADMDPITAAASRMAGVSATAIHLAEITSDAWVVVFGLGMVGNLAAQLFAIRGCRVIGVDPVASRRKLAHACGIPHTVGGSQQEVYNAIREITGGEMARITVDAVGHSAVIQEALKATVSQGQVVLLGTPRAPCPGDITTLLQDIHLRMLTVRGALEWYLPAYPPETGLQFSLYEKHRILFDWIQRGLLRIAPLISHRLNPREIGQGYEGLRRDPEVYTGVALDWRQLRNHP